MSDLNFTGCGVFPPPEFNLSERILFLIINIITSLVSIFGNGLVIFSVITYPHLRTRTTTFLVSLSISDFLIAIFVQPLASVVVLLPSDVSRRCWVIYLLGYSTMSMCGINGCFLALISYDRYQYINQLSNYYINMTVLKVTILSISCWIFSPLFGAFIFYKNTQDVFFFFVFFVLVGTMATICVFYCKSYRTVQKRSVRLNSSQGIINQKKSQQLDEHWRMTKSLSSIIICYIISWTPMTIFVVVTGFDHYLNTLELNKSPITPKLLYFAILCGFLGSCIKPILYYRKTQELRNGMASMCSKVCCCCRCCGINPMRSSIRSHFSDTLGKDNYGCRLPTDELSNFSVDASTI